MGPFAFWGSVLDLSTPLERKFALHGTVEPLFKAVRGPGGHKPTRPLGGWLMVYALIGPNGGLTPVVDRDKHIMECASELGRIQWDEYLEKGHWNDTHNESILVGHGSNLEFHGAHTALAKAHRKVGFWTSGHLWDPDDPDSWRRYGDHVPSAVELAKADRFWNLATCLNGASRPLGFSAHGMMEISPCRSRILSAWCRQAAVCDLPKNPAATTEPMRLAELLADSPLSWMRKGMVARHDRPCGRCQCPPGAACLQLRKGEERPELGDGVDLDPENPDTVDWDDPAEKLEALIAMIMSRYFVNRADALRWIRNFNARKDGQGASNGQDP